MNLIIGQYIMKKIYKMGLLILTDMGSGSLVDTSIGPLCFFSILSWTLLS
jgi:hypothetical protein